MSVLPDGPAHETAALYQSAPRTLRCRRLGRALLVSFASVLVVMWAVCQSAYIVQVVALVVELGDGGLEGPHVYRIVEARYTLWTAFEYNIVTGRVTQLGRLPAFNTTRIMALAALGVTVVVLGLAITLSVLSGVFENQRLAADAKTQEMHNGVWVELRLRDQQRPSEHACYPLALAPEGQALPPPWPSPTTPSLSVPGSHGGHVGPIVRDEIRIAATFTTHEEQQGSADGADGGSAVVMGSVLDSAAHFSLAELSSAVFAPTVVTVGAYREHLRKAAAADYRRRHVERLIGCVLLALIIAVDVLSLVEAIHVYVVVVPQIEDWVIRRAPSHGPSLHSWTVHSSPVGVLAVISLLISLIATGIVASGRGIGVAWMF